MNFFAGFGKGVSSFFRAFGLIFEKGLWHYIFYPLIMMLVMYLLTIFLVGELAQSVKEWVEGQIKLESVPDEGHWLSWAKGFITGWLGVIIGILIKIIMWFISGTFVKYVTLIFLSPIMSLLSESVEEKLTGKKFPFNFGQLMKDVLRGTLISLRNMMLEYLLILAGFIVCLIFAPLTFIVTPLLFIIGWYFIGFSMMDYSCERNKMKISEGVSFIRRNKGIAVGLGFCYSLFFILPTFIGTGIGMMFGPIMAVTGATIAFIELRDKTDAKKI
jgi:CysZ protein